MLKRFAVVVLIVLFAAPAFAQDPIGRVTLPAFALAAVQVTQPTPADLAVAIANLQVQVVEIKTAVAAIQAAQGPSWIERVLTSSAFWVPVTGIVTLAVGRYAVPKK